MNDFDIGNSLGRFFWSIITNPLFCGFAFRIGIDEVDDGTIRKAFAISIQFMYLMISIGWVLEDSN